MRIKMTMALMILQCFQKHQFMAIKNQKISQIHAAAKMITKTENQKQYLSYLSNEDTKLIIATGHAGTGKTYIACQYALEKICNKSYQRIIVTRPMLTVSNEAIGYLPGSLETKIEPWMKNIINCLKENTSSNLVKSYLASKQIEFVPMGFMRGSTIQNTIVIADEMQNSTPMQMKMLLTRIGENSKMIITGDIHQKDQIEKSGLEDILEKLELYKSKDNLPIEKIEFTLEDIQREGFVKTILEIYDAQPPKNKTLTTLEKYRNLINDDKPDSYDAAMIPKSQYTKTLFE
jgi:phosphate starvation-inducible protein PhoH and related proteins